MLLGITSVMHRSTGIDLLSSSAEFRSVGCMIFSFAAIGVFKTNVSTRVVPRQNLISAPGSASIEARLAIAKSLRKIDAGREAAAPYRDCLC